MTDVHPEPRAFQTAGSDPDAWIELESGWDAVASGALIRRVRWHTGLSQAEFAAAFHIDLEQLRALERGLVRPDKTLVAYLTVIDRAPEIVRAALSTC